MVVFKGERIYECSFHAAGFYLKNFKLHPAAYNSPRIKLLQLRATLSDEDNVIAKRGTRGGIGLFNPPSINAICLVIPEISRIGKRVKSSAYSKATALWVYLQQPCELHHDLSRVWYLSSRKWNDAVDVYRYLRHLSLTGPNRKYISMQHNTWDKSFVLQRCLARAGCLCYILDLK